MLRAVSDSEFSRFVYVCRACTRENRRGSILIAKEQHRKDGSTRISTYMCKLENCTFDPTGARLAVLLASRRAWGGCVRGKMGGWVMFSFIHTPGTDGQALWGRVCRGSCDSVVTRRCGQEGGEGGRGGVR